MSTALDADDREPLPSFCLDFTPDDADNRTAWIRRFFRTLPFGRLLLNEEGLLWYCPRTRPPYPIYDLDEFYAITPELALYYRADSKTHNLQRRCDLTRCEARFIFGSKEAKDECLPHFRFLVTEPCVALVDDRPLLVEPGFNGGTGIYYLPAKSAQGIVPLDGVHHLRTCFQGVRFEDPSYRANLLAWLLGALVLQPEFECPLMAVTGNQGNIGKTKTIEACGYLLTGSTQPPISTRADEFQKQLPGRFGLGQRFISLDNVVPPRPGEAYHNSLLTVLLTQGWSKTVRVLGASRDITQKGVLFALSANACRLDNDLASRALSVKLWSADAPYKIEPFVLDYAREYRKEIYGELLGLALSYNSDLRESKAYRYWRWLQFVRPLIEPHFGPLTIQESSDLNELKLDFYTWLADRAAEAPAFTAKDLAQQFEHDIGLRGMKNHFDQLPTKKGRLNALSRYLNKQIGDPVVLDKVEYTLRVAHARSTNQPASYICETKVLETEEECVA